MALATPFIAAGAILYAAWIAGRLTHHVKVSEFRQAWINDLRKDIADYIGASWRWYWKYQELNELTPSSEKGSQEMQKMFSIRNEAFVILCRIKLRLNPNPNINKEKDDRFYQSLENLIDSGKLFPRNQSTDWQRLVDIALGEAQQILKREWEVTKALRPRTLCSRRNCRP